MELPILFPFEPGTFPTPLEGGENTSEDFEDFLTENGSSQGQNLYLTGLCVPSSGNISMQIDIWKRPR